MRTCILVAATLLVACAPSYGGKSDDSGADGTTDGRSGNTSTWVEIQVGYCSIEPYSLVTGETGETERVNEDGGSSQRVSGGYGEMLEVFCDASVVPQYDLPSVEVDPASCAKVYCNPSGGTNRELGEDESCATDLWVYVYPEAWSGDYTECGPWTL